MKRPGIVTTGSLQAIAPSVVTPPDHSNESRYMSDKMFRFPTVNSVELRQDHAMVGRAEIRCRERHTQTLEELRSNRFIEADERELRVPHTVAILTNRSS